MLEFAYPLAYWALPLPLLVWWLMPPQRERVSALRVPFFEQIAEAAGEGAGAENTGEIVKVGEPMVGGGRWAAARRVKSARRV